MNICLHSHFQENSKLIFIIMVKDSVLGEFFACWHLRLPLARAGADSAGACSRLLEGRPWEAGPCAEPRAQPSGPASCSPKVFLTAERWSNCLILALSYKQGNSSLGEFLLRRTCFDELMFSYCFHEQPCVRSA